MPSPPDDPGIGSMAVDNDVHSIHGPPPPEQGNPLLPGPLARSISFGTGSIRGAVRTARSVGRVPFQVARYTTAASIEVGRQAFEVVLGQTGRSLYAQYATRGGANSEAGEADRLRVASVIESTFDVAHRGFHYLQLFTAAGFELTGSSVATLMDLSEVLLLLVDSTLGSTESSRALRSIINFMSLEFQNPATGLPGERVGFRDLMWGLCGLVYLQHACQRLDDEERARLAIETVIWDVVVLDGRRVDVHESSLYGSHRGAYSSKSSGGDDDNRQWPPQPKALTEVTGDDNMDLDDGELPESLIRQQVLAAMSSDARITVSTSTAKIITVDITGSQPPPPISPPPGVELIELGPLHSPAAGSRPTAASSQETTYRIVFRINTGDPSTSMTTISPPSQPTNVVEQLDDDDVTDTPMEDIRTEPTLPAKQEAVTSPRLNKPLPNPQTPPKAPSTSASPSQPSVANQKKVRQPPAVATAPAPTSSRAPPSSSAKPTMRSRASSSSTSTSTSTSTTTKQAAGTNEKKGSIGLRAVLKRGNLLHKDPPAQTSKAADASTASSARKGAAGRTVSPIPPPPPKKAKSSGTAAPSPPSIRQPIPPVRTSSSAQKTQMVRTPLTSRALFRHEAPSPGSRDSDPSYPNINHRARPSMTADDLESLASLASLASNFADNISIHTTSRAGETPQFHQDEYDFRQTLAVPNGGTPSRPGTANGAVKGHRSRANRNSIYTLHTNDSQASLILSAYGPGRRRSGLFENLSGVLPNNGQGPSSSTTNPANPGAIDTLSEVRRTGRIAGMFPAKPLLHNLQRYMRFSSAAYGRDFLRAMGISSSSFGNTSSSSKRDSAIEQPPHHHEIASYAKHTGVAPEDIVMASFIDAKGGPDSSGETRMPLVHYISLDHASKAVVLACRGTLGFEDILADMACEYDSLYWRGRTYQVHKGIHASARRLLYGGDGRVLATLRDALLRYPDYGLVLCGHSLGGAVTALLGVMLSEPRPVTAGSAATYTSTTPSGQLLGQFFQTKSMPPRLLVSESNNGAPGAGGTSGGSGGGGGGGAGREVPSLPPGRPVHVFAFGPPGTMSPGLCKVTRGLITSTVQGYDLVPFLSLGVLHDFQAVALAFKTDDSQASAELWGRLWDKFRSILAQKWSSAGASSHAADALHKDVVADRGGGVDDAWAYAALKTLRASMLSQKLLPPGEVLVVETQRVLQRTTYGGGGGGGALHSMPSSPLLMVSPARRVVLKYVRDVEARFREIRFGLAAFADHSPGRYERALDQLVVGVQL